MRGCPINNVAPTPSSQQQGDTLRVSPRKRQRTQPRSARPSAGLRPAFNDSSTHGLRSPSKHRPIVRPGRGVSPYLHRQSNPMAAIETLTQKDAAAFLLTAGAPLTTLTLVTTGNLLLLLLLLTTGPKAKGHGPHPQQPVTTPHRRALAGAPTPADWPSANPFGRPLLVSLIIENKKSHVTMRVIHCLVTL